MELLVAGMRVLLVDDSPSIRKLIARILEKIGCVVVEKSDGLAAAHAALAAAHAGRPFEVILMDMEMPLNGGARAVRLLRTAGYTGAIIALTGHDSDEIRQQCLQQGFDNFASKPIRKTALETLLSQYRTQAAAGS